MQNIWQNLRYGGRMLFKNPGFTLVILCTLAIGIGANTAIFSVVNSVLLRPLNYFESDRIMTIWEDHTRREGPAREWTSPPGFQDWREQSKSFSSMAAITNWRPTLTEAGDPEKLNGANVSYEAFNVLGASPFLGRFFTPEEDSAGAPKVAVISYGLWQRRFNSDPQVIGKTARLSDESYTIIGVAPPGLIIPFVSDFDITRTLKPVLNPGCQRGCYTQRVIARLKTGVSTETAKTELTAIAGRIEQQFPDSNKNVGVTLTPLHELIVGDVRRGMLALLIAVGFVLLIVCANVTNLLLVRAAAREREIAVRAALGASRFQIVKQLVVESLLLGLIGGGIGVLLAFWLIELFKRIAPDGAPRIDEITIDNRVLIFSLGVSILTGLACGLAPAWQASKNDLNQVLRDAGAGNRISASGRLRSVLATTEIAIALTLLIGAGLLIRSFSLLQSVDPGFTPAHLLTAQVGLPQSMARQREQVAAFYSQLQERLKALPGVQAASFASSVPMTGVNTDAGFQIEGRPAPPPDQQPVAWVSIVGPGYFETMNIRLQQGRAFIDQDHEKAPRTVVISETLARRYWPNENPIGKRIGSEGEPVEWREIVGVVSDIKHFGLDADARPTMYFSAQQIPVTFNTLTLRVQGDPMSYVSSVRREVQALDPNLAISNVQTMDNLVATTIAVPRLAMLLFSSFAGVALLLAALGIYGVMAYSVSQRTQEIGIRVALGAQVKDVMKMVIGQGMKLAIIGVGIGLAASFVLTRLMKTMLYGISATDPLTFISIAALFVLVALIACWLPARRATKIDPIIALRYE